jgi:hypothetical protein
MPRPPGAPGRPAVGRVPVEDAPAVALNGREWCTRPEGGISAFTRRWRWRDEERLGSAL